MNRLLTLTALVLASQASAATLTVWNHFTDAAEVAWLRAQAAAFQKATGTAVNIVALPLDQIPDKLLQAAPKGQGPDMVVTLPQDRLGQLASAGIIEPLDKYLTSKTDLDKTALSAMTYNGKLFGLPMFAESVALIYNKKIVKTAPTTWDEFIKVAQANTGNGKFGFLVDLTNAYANYGIFSAYGSYIFKNNGGTLNVKDVGIGNAGALKAVSVMNDLRYKYNLVPEGVTADAAKGAFVDGRLGMLITGPWDMGDIKKAGIDYGITTLPTPPGATSKWSPFVGVQGVILNAYGKNKAAAAQFAKMLVSQDSQTSFNQAGGRIPVSLAARTKLKNNPIVQGFGKAISAGTPMPNVPQMGAIWGPWGSAVAQSVQKPNPDYRSILDSALKEVSSNIK
ncbi:arabinogalactan oligomer/maltooligosaccharide transport system substrate-binding protein [Deinococcus metalli]|uniref:Arabinogalactan oligomer/maltooligosaccharide transport system substrate-binding protein n=1 Tax=Deinococcus metalli TaxID=1141878 RepID=A0A7W8KF84_9DEIO|nr:maltose ABC transporter substrate-binding protein [Deinococcus metalli]MBB5377036.1 arabinogalactan oligomer/maltooligosaccharide transport system substrate-binding protein [Deinococcus metalli]GHF49402.1 maltose ABC transporter substrate-binding protein [Deinococcus metalli]